MKNLKTEAREVTIHYQGKAVKFKLRPFTYARMAELTAIFSDGEVSLDLYAIIQNPTGLEIAKIAYCLMPESDRIHLDKYISVEINGETRDDLTGFGKLYFLMSEVALEEGHNNMVAVSHAIHLVILASMPIGDKKNNKKKVLRLFKKTP